MLKLYTEIEYAQMAKQAKEQHKKLYRKRELTEFEVDVPDFNIVGYKTEEQKTFDFETGEEKTIYVEIPIKEPILCEITDEYGEKSFCQKTHKEIRTGVVENLEIQDAGYYECIEDNLTDGTLNEMFDIEKSNMELRRVANLKLTRGDVFRGLLYAKGITRMQIREKIEGLLNLNPEEKEKAMIDFEEALEFYRGNPLIDIIASQFGISSKQLDSFFETNDYKALMPDESAINDELNVSEGEDND